MDGFITAMPEFTLREVLSVSSGELLFTRTPTAFYDFREKVWLTYLDHKYFYEQSLADVLKS